MGKKILVTWLSVNEGIDINTCGQGHRTAGRASAGRPGSPTARCLSQESHCSAGTIYRSFLEYFIVLLLYTHK